MVLLRAKTFQWSGVVADPAGDGQWAQSDYGFHIPLTPEFQHG